VTAVTFYLAKFTCLTRYRQWTLALGASTARFVSTRGIDAAPVVVVVVGGGRVLGQLGVAIRTDIGLAAVVGQVHGAEAKSVGGDGCCSQRHCTDATEVFFPASGLVLPQVCVINRSLCGAPLIGCER
jgi:hypothetical protein